MTSMLHKKTMPIAAHSSALAVPYAKMHLHRWPVQETGRQRMQLRCTKSVEDDLQQEQNKKGGLLEADSIPDGDLNFSPLPNGEVLWTSLKLIFALPWRRFKKGSILSMTLSKEIEEVNPPRFSKTLALPSVCGALIKAAYDPRVDGLMVKIEGLSCGWGKLMEIRRHIDFFNASGKFSIAYMETGGEKEYFLASSFKEIYVPPSGNVYLRGLAVSGTFLKGALDKVGIEPQVKRIGNYKSLGDQLMREEMSVYQKEQLQALLDDLYNGFISQVAKSRGIEISKVEKALDEGYLKMEDYQKAGFFTDLKYKDEIIDMIKERQNLKKHQKVKRVSFKKYKNVPPSTFGLNQGKKAIAIVRASGAITNSDDNSTSSSSIVAKKVIRDLRKAADMKSVVAIVLRVDSPGGDALASDLLWREIQQISKKKPIIASMADVAASGGYYMAMAAENIVAESLTLTGSIGVVLAKIGLKELYKKIGIGKETLSRGRYAELFSENRSFTSEEDEYFTELANYAYMSFRDKAAMSRGISPEEMQQYAQGRVWSGARAVQNGLIDALGGITKAVSLAKEKANLKTEDRVRVLEVSRMKGSPTEILQYFGVVANGAISLGLVIWGIISFPFVQESPGVYNSIGSVVVGAWGLLSAIPPADDALWEYTMDDVEMKGSNMSSAFLPQAVIDESLLTTQQLTSFFDQVIKKFLR